MTDSLRNWISLPRGGVALIPPDGRPLYRYWLADEDFSSLQDVLRQHLADVSSLDPPSRLSLTFPVLFVLYAAEWWRRRYDGTGWTWQSILADLGAEQKLWSPMHRGDCVERGLRAWKVERTTAGGLRYLRAIALQGGLPLHLLAEAKGGIGRVLKRVLGLAKDWDPKPEIIRGWVESLQHELPKNYRQEAIYDLLSEVICMTLHLVREAHVEDASAAVQCLDGRCPGWRERFPLPISDAQAQGLIEQLVCEAVTKPSTHSEFVVERWLEYDDHNEWDLCSSLVVPDSLSTESIKKKFQLGPMDTLPRTCVLQLEADNRHVGWRLRRLSGHDAYRVEKQPNVISGVSASRQHVVRLIFPDGRVWLAEPQRADALDQDLPWVFEEGPGGRLRWFRQGSGGIRTGYGVIAIPVAWRFHVEGSSQPERFGRVQSVSRSLFRVQGTVRLNAPDSREWRIRMGQAQANEADFRWVGNRCWEGFVEPPLAFYGVPRLYDGMRRIPEHALRWQPIVGQSQFGPVSVVYMENREQVYRARMVILPPQARLKLIPHGPADGTIQLKDWRAVLASVDDPDLTDESIEEPNTLILRVRWRSLDSSHQIPPEWINVTVTWPGNTQVARLRLPFPGRGVRAYDAQGRGLKSNSWCPVHRLAGVRLVPICVGRQLNLRLQLRNTQYEGEHIRARMPIRAQPDVTRLEIRLQDYVEEIERLLAADELLDTWVDATLCAGPEDLFTLRLSRYICPLIRNEPNIDLTSDGLTRIAPEILQDLPVQALRLEAPGEESLRLDERCSEGVAAGSWKFLEPNREPGSWLIYPAKDALERFRPTLWIVDGATSPDSSLTQALGITDREERAIALDGVIARMAQDYTDSDWSELEQFAGHLGHLPLVSFDLWRRLVHSPAAMVALALRLHTDLPLEFVAKFACELPFAWELIPFQTWLEGAGRRLHKQCVAWFGGNLLWHQELERRLIQIEGELGARYPSLGKLLGLVRCFTLDRDCPEVRMMAHPTSALVFGQQLFEGPASSFQQLLQGHPEDEWPIDQTLSHWINAQRSYGSPGAELFRGDRLGFKDGVINLPILLAIQVSRGETHVWFEQPARIHRLRCFRAFDPEWFDTAFDLTIARCLATGLLRLPESF